MLILFDQGTPSALDELSKMSGIGFDGMLVRLLLPELKSERTSSARDSM
jgi:hypothetical protein